MLYFCLLIYMLLVWMAISYAGEEGLRVKYVYLLSSFLILWVLMCFSVPLPWLKNIKYFRNYALAMWDCAPSVESLHHIVAKLVWIRMMEYFSVAFSGAFHIRFFVFVSFPLPSLYLFIYLLIWLTTLYVAFLHFYIYQTRLVL